MELNYNSASQLRAFLEQAGLGMRKKYGQNFLINSGVRQALVDALGAEAGAEVWEVGGGLGAMTGLLLEKGFLVRVFEIDPGFASVMRELFGMRQGFTLVQGDVMKTWMEQPAAPYLLGNLPYNIAAALLANFIERGRLFTRMAVTVQREVALRMTARPGSADYSSFSLLCSSVYTVRPLMVIRGASFYPRPNVDSQGVLLERRADISPGSYPSALYPLVRRLFASRRKMIKNNLAAFIASRTACLGEPGELAAGVLAANGIKGEARAETLVLEDFAALAQTIEDMENKSKDVNRR
ncbi:MAG: 16S rRNA (adenine(1518)-N(6)/adenine(1519)-N(6))-dimethyltransferase RsmA [Treponema sp.]|jgi:16S rRNA (adenine1518-N6/adenine1519-N6)-dimethyltransferase|nr:16S rRNA (adenine(1518)-N(6)/adenine(1519)-N(6))-dimethyltransferase RsmA [Treponema sp.]